MMRRIVPARSSTVINMARNSQGFLIGFVL
jgi:hypothetical protein